MIFHSAIFFCWLTPIPEFDFENLLKAKTCICIEWKEETIEMSKTTEI